MLVHALLNFDDVLFPTTELTRFFQHHRGEFALPQPVQDQLESLDRLLHRVISHHLERVRFRVLTRAPATWLQACLRWLPQLRRYVDWKYVQLVSYEDTPRQTQMHQLLLQEPLYGMYWFLGDTVDEDVAIPVSLRQNAALKWRVLQFAHKPTLAALLYEWDHLPSVLQRFLSSKEPVLRQHFVVSDDCQQPYASPGWYTNASSPPPRVAEASVASPPARPGPGSATGVFALPPPVPRPFTSPVLKGLDKTLQRGALPPVLELQGS